MVKYLQLYEALKKNINEGIYAFDKTIPTENQLCAEFAVSKIVVRMAVDKLVAQNYVARKAGYGTTVTKDIRKSPSNKLIGVIFCYIASSFGAQILLSIEREALKYGLHIVFKNSGNDKQREKECLSELLELNVAGIIMQPVHNENFCEGLLPFLEKEIPVVLIDRDLEKMDISFVGTDSILETKNSVSKLFKLGYRKLGFVSQDIASATSLSERVKGFRLAHEAANIKYDKSLLLSNISSIANYTVTNYITDKENIKNFLLYNYFDCVIAAELGVSQMIDDVINENEAFKNIALATFDQSETALKYGKYYILQNQTEIGEKAILMLCDQINTRSKCIKQFLTTEFVSF